jgi:branched-chain amino acid transport system substrate-binding protein
MNIRKYGVLLVIVIAIVIGVVSILLLNSREGEKEIRIGAALPLTGDIASYGVRAKNGIQLALEEIEKSGEQKIKISIDFQDSKGTPKEAVAIMKKFCSIDKYPVVIGEAASSVTLAMVPIANQNKVVQISPISSSPELTEKGGDYFFRVCPSDAFQAAILAEWMWELKIKKVGILFVNNSWGISLKDRFISEFATKGGTISITESCSEGDSDFRTQLTKITASKPDAFYCPTYGKEGGLILRQLKELGFTNPIFGSDVWSSSELLTSAGDAAEGVYLVKPAEYKGGEYEAFRSKYVSKYNEEPDVYAAYSYDIIMILTKSFDEGKTTGSALREYLLSMPTYKGVTGETKFDKNGDCNTKAFIKQRIVGNKYIEVR